MPLLDQVDPLFRPIHSGWARTTTAKEVYLYLHKVFLNCTFVRQLLTNPEYIAYLEAKKCRSSR